MVDVTLVMMSGVYHLGGNLNSTKRPWDRDDTCHNEEDDIPGEWSDITCGLV